MHNVAPTRLATALLLSTVLLTAPQQTVARPVESEKPLQERLDHGMSSFMTSLDKDQSNSARYEFDDQERFDLRLAPLGLEGLRIDEMSDAQWRTLEDLLAGILSTDGMRKLNTIRSLEREVSETEGGLFGLIMDRIRLPSRYFFALFGNPGTGVPWAFRFDGHHLSLNVTAVPGAPISATPLFLGGQPRVVPQGLERAGLRVLAEEEELAVLFINGLSEKERSTAALPFIEGSAIRRPMSISEDVDLVLPEPTGLDRAGLDDSGRKRFDALVDALLGNFQTEIAEPLRQGLRGNDGPVTFLYAAGFVDDKTKSAESGKSLYYRIQGGGLSIEFDDTSEAADHIHIVYRHPGRDFGRDILAEHLAAGSHGPHARR